MDVLVTFCVAEDFVVGSIVWGKIRDRWLKLEHKKASIKANNKTPKQKF